MTRSTERRQRGVVRPLVLLAEDDPELRRTFALSLARACEVVECGDGVEALEYFGSSALGELPYPDLLVVDEHLPRMDGLDLLAELRQHDPFLPAIVVTGHGDAALRARAARLGVIAVLEKPIALGALEAWVVLVATCFGTSRRRAEVPVASHSPTNIEV